MRVEILVLLVGKRFLWVEQNLESLVMEKSYPKLPCQNFLKMVTLEVDIIEIKLL